MGLPRLSIKHPISTLMVMFIAIVIGLASLIGSPMELMPQINPPIAVVMTVFPGASPNEVSTLVTKPLEDAVATAAGLTSLSSASQENVSVLTIQFDWGTDMSEARADLQQAIDGARLPEGARKPTLIKFNPNALPVMELTVASGEELSGLKLELEEEVIPRLEKVDGVAAVFVTGAPDREIQVLLDPAKLNQYGLDQQRVANVLQASNLTYPAGKITLGEQSLNLRIVGKTSSVDQLRALVIAQVPAAAQVGFTPQSPGAATRKPGALTAATDAPDQSALTAATDAPDQGSLAPDTDAPDQDSPAATASDSPEGPADDASDPRAVSPAVASGMQAAPAAGGSLTALIPIRLADVAEIRDGYAEETVINRTDGEPSLRITFQKEGEANTVNVSRAVNDELDEIRKDHRGLDLVRIMDQGEMAGRSVSNVGLSLIGGGLLAMLVLLLFLRNFRPTLIIGVAIPFSVIVTFVLLYLNDLTMNLMTLGGLALGVGMLVDNAIVVIENIYRHLNELGEEPRIAAERGANEVAGAITASTLTTVTVFLPVVFVGGLTGELFKELALTVTFSLIASLSVALTVIPMMASRFLKPQAPRRNRHESAVQDSFYVRALRWALSNRVVTLLAAVAVMAGSLGLLAPAIGTEFIPEMDEGAFTVSVTLPPGTSLQSAADRVEELAQAVKTAIPAEIVTTSTGRSEGLAGLAAAMNGGSVGDGQIRVIMDEDYNEPTSEAIKDVRQVLDKIKGDAVLSYNVESSMNMGGARGNSIQMIVTGPDQGVVRDLVQQVQGEMATIKGLVNLENNLDISRPELQVVVNQEQALRNGLVPAQIAVTVAEAMKGKIVTRIETGDTTADVRVQYRAEERESIPQIEEMLLKTPFGTTIPLSDVAAVEEAIGPVSITREDQKSSAQITGRIEERDLGSVTVDLNALIDEMRVPDGFEVTLGGTSRMMSEGFSGLKVALLLAILLIYMIMASQFESLLHPFIILFTMPLAITGVVGGLYLTDSSLGITAMIGVIILAGIVVNNGIVLVDFINKLRRSGLELTAAIVEAGRTRLRPILMTALTTILGLLPLALKLGTGLEVQAPMAITVIGGLLTSTVLTLVVIPVMYHLLAFEGEAVGAAEQQAGGAESEMPAAVAPPAPTAPVEAQERLPKAGTMSDGEFAQMLSLMGKLFAAAGRRS